QVGDAGHRRQDHRRCDLDRADLDGLQKVHGKARLYRTASRGARRATMTTTALIVAAGTGERAGGGMPKQFRLLGGKPVLRWAVESLVGHPAVQSTRIVIAEGQQANAPVALEGLDVGDFITGGATR